MDRRTFLATCISAATGGAAGCSGRNWHRNDTDVSRITDGPAVALEPAVSGLNEPLDLVTAPETDIWYVADRKGVVHLVEDGRVADDPLIDLTGRLAALESWEQGLLGLAAHPDFASNDRLYVRYSAPPTDETPGGFSHTFVLSEFRVTPDRRSVVPGSERRILKIPQPGAWHQSGAIVFGPDDYLYVGVGDGGAPRDSRLGGYRDTGLGHASDWYDVNTGGNGQDVTQNLLGSILRIDVDAREDGRPYGIPDDNPLVGREGLDEQYAWGFRNPFRMSFDGDRLYVGDVGAFTYEEVDVVEAGGNYGWNVQEGPGCFNSRSTLVDGFLNDLPEWIRRHVEGTPLTALDDAYRHRSPAQLRACPDETPQGNPLVDPVIAYPHERNGEPVGSAVIGGHVVNDSPIETIQGDYLFGDLMAGRSGRLFVASPGSEKPWPIRELSISNTETGSVGAAILSFAQIESDSYVLTSRFAEGTGAISRIQPPD